MPNPARAQRRHAAIIAAATDVFLECGFENARMEEIVRRSGGSMATIYANFGDKAGLFGAIIRELCNSLAQHLSEVGRPAGPLQKALTSFGESYVRMLLTPISLTLYRIAVAESSRFPDLGRAVYAAGPAAATAQLAEYLGQHMPKRRGLDMTLAAAQFLEMVKREWHLRALLNPAEAPSERVLATSVRQAARIFLGGMAAPTNASPR